MNFGFYSSLSENFPVNLHSCLLFYIFRIFPDMFYVLGVYWIKEGVDSLPIPGNEELSVARRFLSESEYKKFGQ